MLSLDFIDDLFSEGGFEKVVESLVKEFVKGNLIDLFFSVLPFLIGFIIFYTIFKNVVAGIFKGVGSVSGSVGDRSSGLLGSIYDFLFGQSFEEEPTDKAQRLLGDGEYLEAAKFLRGHLKSNTNDQHAKALYEIALNYSGNSRRNDSARYGSVQTKKPKPVKRTDNNASYGLYDDDNDNTPLRGRLTSTRKIAELGSDLVKAASGHKLTKAQMVHFAKTGELPGRKAG